MSRSIEYAGFTLGFIKTANDFGFTNNESFALLYRNLEKRAFNAEQAVVSKLQKRIKEKYKLQKVNLVKKLMSLGLKPKDILQYTAILNKFLQTGTLDEAFIKYMSENPEVANLFIEMMNIPREKIDPLLNKNQDYWNSFKNWISKLYTPKQDDFYSAATRFGVGSLGGLLLNELLLGGRNPWTTAILGGLLSSAVPYITSRTPPPEAGAITPEQFTKQFPNIQEVIPQKYRPIMRSVLENVPQAERRRFVQYLTPYLQQLKTNPKNWGEYYRQLLQYNPEYARYALSGFRRYYKGQTSGLVGTIGSWFTQEDERLKKQIEQMQKQYQATIQQRMQQNPAYKALQQQYKTLEQKFKATAEPKLQTQMLKLKKQMSPEYLRKEWLKKPTGPYQSIFTRVPKPPQQQK